MDVGEISLRRGAGYVFNPAPDAHRRDGVFFSFRAKPKKAKKAVHSLWTSASVVNRECRENRQKPRWGKERRRRENTEQPPEKKVDVKTPQFL
jgi:hypothetical protein